MVERLYSNSWYRVESLRPKLRSHARLYRHHYRGKLWYVLEDLSNTRYHRFTPEAYNIIGLMDGQRTVQEIWDLATESLKDVVARMLPYWHDAIVPALRKGLRVLISAHGNSLRALVKHLDGISDEDIPGLNIPTGIPLVYELDEDLGAIRHYYLGDPEAAAAAARAVAEQAKQG